MKIEKIDKLVIVTVKKLPFSEVYSAIEKVLTVGKGKAANVILDLSRLTQLTLRFVNFSRPPIAIPANVVCHR